MVQKKQRIAILYHYVPKKNNTDYFSEEHVLVDNQTDDIIPYIKKVLHAHGYGTQIIRVAPDNLSELTQIHADFIFNLVDSKEMELRIARILDKLHVPYSGSSYEAIRISNNKIASKILFVKHHLPVAPYTCIHVHDRIGKQFVPSSYPVIVKPAFEHCSIGIDVHSIAENYEQFKSIVYKLRKEHKQTLIAEKYITGKELQVTVYETKNGIETLPIAEVAFKKGYKSQWNIYGYDAKWNKRTNAYKNCYFDAPPKGISQSIDHQIKQDAVKAFCVFGLKGYARFDLRYDVGKKEWFFLEANANPGIDPNTHDAMTRSVIAAGLTLDDFIVGIVKHSMD